MNAIIEVEKYLLGLVSTICTYGFKAVLAIIYWLIGRFVIKSVIKIIHSKLEKNKTDKTLIRYLNSVASITLEILLVVALLGFMGIQTTTFAALIAACGLALGMSWSGLLSNFAAGAFIMFLRPFKVGDLVTAGGITGEVKEIGIFTTSINTSDNVLSLVGNNAIFSGTIQNYSANPYRRVDLTAQLSPSDDYDAITKELRDKVAKIPNVLSEPAVDVSVSHFTLAGPVISIRPYCAPSNYIKISTETNEVIRQVVPDGKFIKAMIPDQVQKAVNGK